MPTCKLNDRSQAEDLIRGLTLLGTGGGGRPEAGRESLQRILDRGRPIEWIDARELPDEGFACAVFSVGSTAPRPADFKEGQTYPGYGTRALGTAMPRAVRELETYTGKRITTIFPIELGANNTATPLYAAAELELKLIDGDASGRAVPEASQVTPAMQQQSFAPAAIADEWGNVLLLKHATSLDVAEAIAKGISIITKMPDPYAICAVAAYLMPVAEMKRAVIQGTLSRAFAVGKIIREARERRQDPVRAAAKFLEGVVLFKGSITKREWESKGGYQIGTTDIAGVGEFAGHLFRIWFKNEHHITWRDGQPFVTSPDLIAVVASDTGEPITNTYLAEGMNVAVIGAPGDPAFRTPIGIATLGPRHFGFDLEYRPIGALVSSM
ncbi:MAG: DUF917 domain-containing protein [Chloroflexi bacterium]|nr:DUF917 domain-containing protein [Chloroflexota bacterium]